MSSSRTPSLRLDWCSYEAARYAVEHWHYSRRMPLGPLLRVGAWENGAFIGCVLFGRGATPSLVHPFGLTQLEGCELVRVALTHHHSSVTRIVAIALKLLRRTNPGLRLVVSFADPAQGHIGVIYQGGGWLYAGKSAADREYWHEGRWKHSREMRGGAFGGKRRVADYSALVTRVASGKYRYLMPLDAALRAQLAPLAKPYPRRPRLESEASGIPVGHEGAAMRPDGSTLLEAAG